jgi:hypothetical protein
MKTVALTTVVIGALLAADGAFAKPHDDHRKQRNDRYEQGHDYDHRYDRYDRYEREDRHHRRHFNKRDVVRIDIPVHIRGDERVPLRRMLRNYYNINPNHYHLRKVVVDNRGRHRASARLKVGDYVSGRQHLHQGRNHLRAPRYGDGRWVLKLNNARVNNIRVVLEPKHHYAAKHYPRRWMDYAYRF